MRVATSACGNVRFFRFSRNSGQTSVGIPQSLFVLEQEQNENGYSYWCARLPLFETDLTHPVGIHHSAVGAVNTCCLHIEKIFSRLVADEKLIPLLQKLGFELYSLPIGSSFQVLPVRLLNDE